ncbi:retina and anterior neural fold homeobox protein 2-like [Dermacentor albipictus]|uniref:retina and anterior neural fold homeobox protein 2-like n=1 Tax=Dermacentor albipictus TaxID=60249 RepID=UPI0031FD21B7
MFLGRGSPTVKATGDPRAASGAGGSAALEKPWSPRAARRMTSAAIQAHLQPSYRLPMVLGFQERELEAAFEHNRNPNFSDLAILAAETGLPLDAVKMWFENRLARWRVSQGLPANGRMVNQ